ncbi:MAG: DUF504 domain-containing protein [Methanoregula sp.]|jgi:hypothetical protein|nr:DUF504 domain-containing protein [Methanoregula sp.]
MRKSHELLLKFRFDPRYSFSQVQVWYVDRGATGDHSCVDGVHIMTLDAYYMEIGTESETKRIPYHRIRKILYAGKVVWER